MNHKSVLLRQRRGVSPVLATMIMIGVTIAVGLGVASYTMGLFSNISKTSQVSVNSISINAANDQVTINLINKGGTPATLTSVEVIIGTSTYSASPNHTIGASSSSSVTTVLKLNGSGANANFLSGTTYTFTLRLADGTVLTATSTAT